MSRTKPFRPSVQQLEVREVPAVGVLSEIMPGNAGSNPREFTTSGDKLYFAANNGQGDELYVSNGTAAGTKIVRTIRPGLAGADIRSVVPAGNGVVYFLADDGTGSALWRSNGTLAGTVKVPGVPAIVGSGLGGAVGVGGALYFAVGRSTPESGLLFELWKTNGTTTTLLARVDANVSEALVGKDGKVYFRTHPESGDGYTMQEVWVTDGTPAGTKVSSPRDSIATPEGSLLHPHQLVQVAPGRWLVYTTAADASQNRLYVQDGVDGTPRLLKAFLERDGLSASFDGTGMFDRNLVLNGKLAFRVTSLTTGSPQTMWLSDGTVEGTRPSETLADGSRIGQPLTTFGGRFVAMLSAADGKYAGLVLTDGTAAGTTRLTAPDGAKADYSTTFFEGPYRGLGKLSPSAAYPNGLLVLRSGTRIFVTADTPGSARWVDTTGVTTAAYEAMTSTLIDHRDTAQLNGSLFLKGPQVGTVQPEPWKWDVLGSQTPTPVRPPVVASVKVNDGSGQRSMVTKATVTFDRVVTLADGAIDVRRIATNVPVGVQVSTQVVNGRTVATVTFTGAGIIGGSLADGVYKLTVDGAKVRTAGTTATMVGDHTTTFHRLFGDLDADRHVGSAARVMIHARLGATRGDADYLSGFDYDSDGDIDAGDEYQILKRYGKSV